MNELYLQLSKELLLKKGGGICSVIVTFTCLSIVRDFLNGKKV